ncbi:MAG: TSUP family transporter [Burkholderiales bacterium]|nr:TSUP family transporter [Burkholderiales bacterium]GIK88453.1 MAG: UPF0721 transmembrane protein [Betaproteobacteria bacterium]
MPLPLPDVAWPVLAAVPLIVLAAYTMFGATGFGSSLIAVPLLAHAFPLTFAVPFVTTLDGAATVTASRAQWRDAAWPEIRRILPAALAGIALGATVLVNLPRAPAMLALGLFVGAYGVWHWLGARKMSRANPWWSVPIGVVGGVFSVLFGTGGPIYMVYLSARLRDKTALRATSSLLVTFSVWTRIAVFVVSGLLLDAPMLVLAAMMIPLMFAGLRLGNRLHHALSAPGVLRLVSVLLVANGGLLVARALGALR